MIIEKKGRKEVSKENLAKISTSYANAFLKKLGIKEKVVVSPSQIISNKEEAKRIFLRDLERAIKSTNFVERDQAKQVYSEIKEEIENDKPFYNMSYNLMYIPIISLKDAREGPLKMELAFIEDYARRKNKNGIRILKTNCELDKEIVFFSGLESEIAHLAVDKIINGLSSENKISAGVYEASDTLSYIFSKNREIPLIIKYFSGYKFSDKEKEEITSGIISEYINFWRCIDYILNAFLFKDKKTTNEVYEEIKEKGALSVSYEKFKQRIFSGYLQSYHNDGDKLFLAIYDSQKKDLDTTFREYGKLLTSGDVSNFYTVFKKISERVGRDVLKYEKYYSEDLFQRRKICLDEKILTYKEYLKMFPFY